MTAVGPAGNRASFAALPLVRVTAGGSQPAASARKAAAPASPTFLVGAGIDAATQAPQAQAAGLRLVSMAIPWQPGETSPDPGLVASLKSVPSGLGLVAELTPTQLPADDAGRASLGSYAASLAAQVPSLRDLVLAPAPSLATASAYADALAAIRAAVSRGAIRRRGRPVGRRLDREAAADGARAREGARARRRQGGRRRVPARTRSGNRQVGRRRRGPPRGGAREIARLCAARPARAARDAQHRPVVGVGRVHRRSAAGRRRGAARDAGVALRERGRR